MSVTPVSKQVAFRFTKALLRRIDKYAEQVSKQTGAHITRADAVRMLLKRGLDTEGVK
jgi:hypothetical protein